MSSEEVRNKLRREYKMIADFIGWHYVPFNANDNIRHTAGWYKPISIDENKAPVLFVGSKNPGFITRKTLDLNFRYNWEMLMQVVTFIEGIEDKKHGGFKVIIDSDCCTVQSKLKAKETSYSRTHCSKGDKRKAIYESILAFINFYKS